MHSTDSQPRRILAQPGIDYIEALETELGRNIIITGPGTGNFSNGHDRATRARAKFPEVENPLVVVFGQTLSTDWTWWYMSRFDDEVLVDPAQHTYYAGGEFPSFSPPDFTDIGFEIPTNDGNRIYCEVEENLVVTGLKLVSPNSDDLTNLNWERILGEPIRMAASDDIAARSEQLRVERRQRAFEAFVTQGRDRALNQLRNRITETEEAVKYGQSQLTQSLRSLNDYGKQVTALEATLSEDSGTWQSRFEELCNHPKLIDVEFANETFVLSTDHLRIENPNTGDSRWLGRFKIHVPLGGNSGYSIRFENLDNGKGGRPHPHVASDGPCFGAIGATVSKLHADLELMALVDVLVMFLETFNPKDDWGSYAAYWFGSDDEDPRPEFNAVVDNEMAVA